MGRLRLLVPFIVSQDDVEVSDGKVASEKVEIKQESECALKVPSQQSKPLD